MYQLLVVSANEVLDSSFNRGVGYHKNVIQCFSECTDDLYIILETYLKNFEFFENTNRFNEHFSDKKSLVCEQIQVDLFVQVLVSIIKIDDSLFNLKMFNHIDENTTGDFICTKIPYLNYLEMDEKEIEAFLREHEDEYNEWKYSVDYSTCPAYHLRDVYCIDETSKKIIVDMWNDWLKTDSRKRLPAYIKLLTENMSN